MKERTAEILSWVIVIVYFIIPLDLFPEMFFGLFAYIEDLGLLLFRKKIMGLLLRLFPER
jgi:uncharacterized membrane protein YkvA (DUF1232 family)